MRLISDGPPRCHAGSRRRHTDCHTAKPKRGGFVTPSQRETVAHVYCNLEQLHFPLIANSVVTSETVRQVNNGKGFERHTGLSHRRGSRCAVTGMVERMFHGNPCRSESMAGLDRLVVRLGVQFSGSSPALAITGNSDPVFSLVMSVSLGGYGDA